MKPLDRIAAKARRDPFFLGHFLDRHAAAEGLDDDGLAASLGCPRDNLSALLACRAPRRDEGFREDVLHIGRVLGVDAVRLAEAFRHGEVLLETADVACDGVQALMAARDAEGGEP